MAGGRAAAKRVRPVAPGTLRRRILDYIAAQGGEVRSDSGQGLRRKLCDALGDRPTPVSQALLALEKAGLLEREIDVDRRRCHAIRLIGDTAPSGADVHPATPPARSSAVTADRTPEHARTQAALESAERRLADAIRQAAAASRDVQEFRWALMRMAEERRPPIATAGGRGERSTVT